MTPEQAERFQNSTTILEILRSAKMIAVIGLSTDPNKASHKVAMYLQNHGYCIVPVHPTAHEILGEKAYPSLLQVPDHIDVVDVFRPSAEVAGIVEEAIAVGADAVWTQFDIVDFEAGEQATKAGLNVVMDRCMKVEHSRHFG